ncbi:MAG: dolichyl-phosphate beta-glucosyltransferase [Chthoniobacteraceae bacterium]
MSTSGEPFLSIVIPAYNEVHRLEASIRALREYLHSAPWSHEVLLVIERSTDGTLALARRLTEGHAAFRVIGHDVQRGKGHAVRSGMLHARGEIAFFMDADLSTPLQEMERFIARFSESPVVDVLVGNRQHARSEILMRQHFLRRKMGQTFNAILRTIAGIRLADTQCGFKAFRRAAREAIFPLQKLDGFAFDVEVLLLAEKLGFKVEDMPVEWSNAEGSKVHIVRDSLRMLMDAIRVRRLVAAKIGARSKADAGGG